MCTLFVFAKLYEINNNLLLFLQFRLFRYLFKLSIGIINVTSNTIECFLWNICWTWNAEIGENKKNDLCVISY